MHPTPVPSDLRAALCPVSSQPPGILLDVCAAFIKTFCRAQAHRLMYLPRVVQPEADRHRVRNVCTATAAGLTACFHWLTAAAVYDSEQTSPCRQLLAVTESAQPTREEGTVTAAACHHKLIAGLPTTRNGHKSDRAAAPAADTLHWTAEPDPPPRCHVVTGLAGYLAKSHALRGAIYQRRSADSERWNVLSSNMTQRCSSE